MKIKQLKINAFGNLKDKDISLSNHMNIIQGENESGKSTLLQYIISMFYGLSKNKRGKEYTDYEKYLPWDSTEFSGKLEYILDNGEKYEIFRDFYKKNPKIYNANLEEISKEYNVNKTSGNEFFFEQTNIEESMFLSTLVSKQEEVRIDRQTQNLLVQKIANLAGTGDDSISYKKAIEKLNKKQVEEIGSSRTQGRPINKIQEELKNAEFEKEELNCYKDKQYIIEKRQQELEENIQEKEIELEIIKEIKKINEKEKLEKEKLNINEKIKINNEEKIKELKNEKNKLEEKINSKINIDFNNLKNNTENKNKIENNSEFEKIKNKNTINKIIKEKNKIKNKKKKINSILISILILLIIVFILNHIIIKNNNIFYILSCLIPLGLVGIFYSNFIFYKKYKKQEEKEIQLKKEQEIENNQLKSELEKINSQIEIIEKNIEEEKIEIQKLNKKINMEINLEKEKIKNKYQNKINIQKINQYLVEKNIEEEQENIEKQFQKNKLELHTLFLDKNVILPKLEKLAFLEEKIEILKEQEENLLKDNACIELVKQVLEKAYQKMKENVTPKFTQSLSESIATISNGRYQKVSINDEVGMMIEKENGEYIPANKLSVGTIDQLYISLRLSMIQELTQEKLPIMLDESFAYYDEQRLENILRYLDKAFPEYQILLFTCTNRERQILDKQAIPYQLVKLS